MRKKVVKGVKKEFELFNWQLGGLLVFLILLEVMATFALRWYLGADAVSPWYPALTVAGFVILGVGFLSSLLVSNLGNRVENAALKEIGRELSRLRHSHNRAQSLQVMASTLRATLSFERVVEAALDVCSLALEEAGVPARALVGAVFLYERSELVPVATRSFLPNDRDVRISGEAGVIGEALSQAEPVMSDTPAQDPELKKLLTFQRCETVVCIPLRAGFQIFGAMLIGSNVPIEFSMAQLNYFNSVADHAVIALQNAKLYQDLKAEKQRIIQADEDARKELARDLHDGPTQSVAAIAMRVNFIRSLLERDPEQAQDELDKVEQLARDTSKEIRGMLFTLRPLVLETEGLAAAIETVINRIEETDGLPIRMLGEDAAELLDEKAQSVVFSIVEEALGNARKYSEATQVQVRFWREGDLFVAQIEDNGVGFDVESVNDNYSSRGSLGLVNMHERAERVDGSVRIESQSGKGTRVTLVVPLDHGLTKGKRRG